MSDSEGGRRARTTAEWAAISHWLMFGALTYVRQSGDKWLAEYPTALGEPTTEWWTEAGAEAEVRRFLKQLARDTL